MSQVTLLIKKNGVIKENCAPNTQEQVLRALLSLLYHYCIYIKVSSPNESFY